MDIDILNNITIVLRTHKERTIDLCYKISKQQISIKDIYIVKEVPFFKAVKKTFEIGANNDNKYLLGLDADVLLFSDALEYMLHEANNYQNKEFFRMDFPLFDKFRGRLMGAHLYNNEYSKEFLEFLNKKDEEKNFIRAEYENVKEFCDKKGLEYNYYPHFIVGKHDYFQSYQDIYNKYQLRAKKSVQSKVFDMTYNLIKGNSLKNIDDMDFIFALEGMKSANGNGVAFEEIMKKYHLKEKKPISENLHSMIIETLNNNIIMNKIKK